MKVSTKMIGFLRANDMKRELIELAGKPTEHVRGADYIAPSVMENMLKDAERIGVMVDEHLDMDVRSLRELLIYGLKGMCAYAHHAHILGKSDETVNKFYFKALAVTLDADLGVDDLIELNMELGKANFRCMELLNEANTEAYGDPVPVEVRLITGGY